ncbi:DNA-directed RNA polymerase subunit beta' [subsurface metagenome]
MEELFEARIPKLQATISEIDGIAEVVEGDEGRSIRIMAVEQYSDEYEIPSEMKVMVKDGQRVEIGSLLAEAVNVKAATKKKGKTKELAERQQVISAQIAGEVSLKDNKVIIRYEELEEREYIIPAATHIRVKSGDKIKAGQQLTDGSVNPQDILSILGKEAVHQYLVEEVQKVYCSQGVHINDKHIEVIISQMLSKVRIDVFLKKELTAEELKLANTEILEIKGKSIKLKFFGDTPKLLKQLTDLPIEDIAFPEASLEDTFMEFYGGKQK